MKLDSAMVSLVWADGQLEKAKDDLQGTEYEELQEIVQQALQNVGKAKDMIRQLWENGEE